METYLKCFVHSCPTKWIHWLSLAEFWYNSSHHSALGRSPFEVLYGHPPRHFGLSAASVSSQIADWLVEKTLMQDLVRQYLIRAQERMKRQADKHRSERRFNAGDWVYLKLQPYVQSSLAHRSHQKLAFHFFGPFQVEAHVGAVAYKLALPQLVAIHSVFHVSQLKASHGTEPVAPALPTNAIEFQVPQQILQRRWMSGNNPIEQVLVKWSQMSMALAIWENADRIRQQFPKAPAWGHVGSEEGGECFPCSTHDNGYDPGHR
jgi:hypothetical protein